MSTRSSRRVWWLRIIIHGGALVPLALLAWGVWQDRLGPDWVGELTRRTGRYAITFLLLSLTPTVIAALSGFNGILRVRRTLGLYAFAYDALHFLIFIGLDYTFDFGLIFRAILEGQSVLAGLIALVILVPLAVTSTRSWMRRLGRNWKRLHRLTYVAGGLAVLHYAWKFKELRIMPLLAGIVLFLLLAARVLLPQLSRWRER